jgi:DNA-binding MarR family transcriptional regulator
MVDETQRSADWELLAQFSQAYRGLSDALMDQITLHRSQAVLLCKLFAQDGMTQTELAQQLSVQGATVTDMLQRMEEAGLVTRRRDQEDNRLVRVSLTAAGREKERFIHEQFLKLENTVFAGFDDGERAQLRQLLGRAFENMNRKFSKNLA